MRVQIPPLTIPLVGSRGVRTIILLVQQAACSFVASGIKSQSFICCEAVLTDLAVSTAGQIYNGSKSSDSKSCIELGCRTSSHMVHRDAFSFSNVHFGLQNHREVKPRGRQNGGRLCAYQTQEAGSGRGGTVVEGVTKGGSPGESVMPAGSGGVLRPLAMRSEPPPEPEEEGAAAPPAAARAPPPELELELELDALEPETHNTKR